MESRASEKFQPTPIINDNSSDNPAVVNLNHISQSYVGGTVNNRFHNQSFVTPNHHVSGVASNIFLNNNNNNQQSTFNPRPQYNPCGISANRFSSSSIKNIEIFDPINSMPPFEYSTNNQPDDNNDGNGGTPVVKRESSPSDFSSTSSQDTNMSQSIMMAMAQISLCEVPLRTQIFNLVKNAEPQATVDLSSSPSRPGNNFSKFLKLETNPVLYQLEQDKLDELKNACMLLRNPYEQITRTVKDSVHLADAIKVTEAAIYRLIKMSKRLSSFLRLSQIDQISLLKNSIIEMMCIRATTNYHSESNFWYFIDDQNQGMALVSMEVLKEAKINFLTHKNFAIKFNSQFGTDPTIADLLTAIILFRPSRATVVCREVIEEEFLNYCYLLRRYLQFKFQGDTCLAKSCYITLMHMLEELYHLSDEIIRIYLDMNPEDAGQLFVELFDLK